MPPDESIDTTDEKILADDSDSTAEESEEEHKVEKPKEAKEDSEDIEEESEEESDESEDESDEEVEERAANSFLYDRPSVGEIKEKYPQFFKDFPSLRDAFFREQKYTELFPTIDDAKEAAVDSEALSTLRDSVLQGDPVPLFESIEKSDKASLEAFVTAFLPALYKRDSSLYSKAMTPLLENMTRQMYSYGKTRGDDNLSNAALHLSQYLFDSLEIATGEKTTVIQPKKDEKLEAERISFENEKFRSFHSNVLNEGEEKLTALIEEGFDPNKVFSPFLRKQCIKEIMQQVDSALQSDENHMSIMKSRWVRAKQEGYNGDSKAKIISAYLARAKHLLPLIREKVSNEALGTKAKVAKTQESKVNGKKEVIGSTSKGSKNIPSPQQIDWRKTSDLDFLNDKITLRK